MSHEEHDKATVESLTSAFAVMQEVFEEGSPEKKLEYATHALFWSRQWDLRVPGWVLDYLISCLDKRASLEAPSLDAAFGLKPYTPIKLARETKMRRARATHGERKVTGKSLDLLELAEIFAVSEDTMRDWLYRRK